MFQRRSDGSEKISRSAFVLTLLGALAVASANRIVPENLALSRLVTGASGLHPVHHLSLTGLHMAGRDEVPDPLGVREEMQRANFDRAAKGYPSNSLETDSKRRVREEMQRANFDGTGEEDPSIGLQMDSERISDRGGAPSESWRLERTSTPGVVKEIKIRNEADFFAAQNELEAIRKMLGQGVFLKMYDMWYRNQGVRSMKIVTVAEDYTCTLEDLLKQQDLDALTALDLFVDIAHDLRVLRLKRIAHDPPTAKEIFIVGDTQDLSSCRAMLCSSLTNTNMRVRSSRDAVGRFLAGQDLPSTAKVISKAQVKKADSEGLAHLFNDLARALAKEEYKKLVELIKDLQYDITDSNIVRHVTTLRKKWLVRYPQDVAKRVAKRPKDGKTGSTAEMLDDEAHVARVIKTNMKEASRVMQKASIGDPQFYDDTQLYDPGFSQIDYSASDSETPLHMASDAIAGETHMLDDMAEQNLMGDVSRTFPIDGV